ncbi:MAG TPA: exodeoxyribonuclease VII large subunit [Thermoanaerobaculia bacterium]|nr:exodeoxyribonuclease VII large subunit [Thermoanaerobaculia bacterium]
MTLPFEPTYSVSDLCDEIRALLAEAYPSLWVAGEVQRFRESQRGHVYFELVEKDAADGVCGKLDAVIWARDWQRVRRSLADSGQRLEEGMTIRCRGSIDFYGVGGRLQLVVREVDPVFTLGLLEKRRRETLAALAAAGLLDLNRALPLPDPPLSIGLVTSQGSAAYHDFLATLAESGYGFRVTMVHASVQGQRAEREIVSALALAAAAAVDCVVLVRGGGARSDLAVFDSRAVAEAVARSPRPVLTGLGHEIDEAIADRVAHLALKTPTKVAELLVERVARCDRAAAEVGSRLARAARQRLRDGHEALGRAERGVAHGRTRLSAAGAGLEERARRLAGATDRLLRRAAADRRERGRRVARASPRLPGRRRREVEAMARRVSALGQLPVRAAVARVGALERLVYQLGPERVLARGFSITRDAQGRVLTDPTRVRAGERIATRLAGGELVSRVEED